MTPPPAAPGAFRYWAFISYAHADEAWAKRLHRALETYRVPRRLVGERDGRTIPARLFPVFRDRDELPSTFSLGDKLEQALRDSRFLIVVCSPKSAVSRWVNEEVRRFKAFGGEERVLCLIVDGEPNASDQPESGLLECFPAAARFRVDQAGTLTAERTESIAADVRPGKDPVGDAMLKLIAGMIGVDLDDLKQRERRRRVWRRVQVAVGAALVLSVTGGVWYRVHRDAVAAEQDRDARIAQLLVDKSKAAAAGDDDATASFYGAESIHYSLLAGRPAPLEDDFLASLALAALPDPPQSDGQLAGPLAISPDGALVFAGGGTSAGRVWDVAAHRSRATLAGGGAFTAAAFDAGSVLLATASGTGTLRLWNAVTGGEMMQPREHGAAVTALAFSPDGRWLASAGDDGRIRIWGTHHGGAAGVLAHGGRVQALAWAPDGARLASGGEDHTLRVWTLGAPAAGRILARYTDPVTAVAFSPDGRLLAAGVWDKTVRLWDTGAGQEIASLPGHTKAVESVAFAGDGTLLASSSLDGSVKLWEVSSQTPVTTLTERTERGKDPRPVHLVAFASRGNALLAASDRTLRTWRVVPRKYRVTLTGHTKDVRSVVFDPSGRILASAGDDASIRLWDVATGRLLRPPIARAHADAIRALAFGPDGTWLASAGRDNDIRLWNPRTGALVGDRHRAHDKWIFALAAAPDGRWLASSGLDNEIKRWSVPGLQEITPRLERVHTRPVGGLAVSPDGKWLASAGDDRDVRLWDLAAGTSTALRAQDPPTHLDLARPVAFSPDGALLASGGGKGTLMLWDVATKKPAGGWLRGHHSFMIWALAFSPDGRLLASGSLSHDRQTLRIWDVRRREIVAWLTGHREYVLSLAFSPDGQWLASGGSDKTVRLWRVSDFWPPKDKDAVAQTGALLRPFLAARPYRLRDAERLVKEVGAITGLELVGTDAMASEAARAAAARR